MKANLQGKINFIVTSETSSQINCRYEEDYFEIKNKFQQLEKIRISDSEVEKRLSHDIFPYNNVSNYKLIRNNVTIEQREQKVAYDS